MYGCRIAAARAGRLSILCCSRGNFAANNVCVATKVPHQQMRQKPGPAVANIPNPEQQAGITFNTKVLFVTGE